MKVGKIIRITAIVITAWIVISGVFYFGFHLGTLKPKTIVIEGVANMENGSAAADFKIFWETWQAIKNDYFRAGEVADEDLIFGAAKGLVNSLNDPHSVFFDPKESKKFSEDINGSFGGIGAEISIRDKQLIIAAPLKGTPAEKARLKSGDEILKINDTLTVNMTVPEAVTIIRGEIGTKVDLTIFREGWEKPQVIAIIREEIIVPSIEWEMKKDGIAYVQIYNFNENLPVSFYQAILEIFAKRGKGIIIDLRDNPGGFLETAINIAGWFLERGEVVVKEKFRSGDVRIFRASGNEALKTVPTVVLVNGGSASASEILAGALRDNRGTRLVGEKTFGKGTVQELMSLSGGVTVKISVAEWLLPSGAAIEKVGLVPDYEIKLTDDDLKAGKDPQLEKAMEILKSEIINKP